MKIHLSDVEIVGDICVGNSTLEAWYKNKKIGFITFQVLPDYNGYPSVAYPSCLHTDADYQRNGIATKIIMEAQNFVDVIFQADQGVSGNSNEIHYSSEGLAFKNFCEESGLTKRQEI